MSNNNSKLYECIYCDLLFRDFNMFSLHNLFHDKILKQDSSLLNPFKCGQCGTQLNNKNEFFIHIAKQAHNNIMI